MAESNNSPRKSAREPVESNVLNDIVNVLTLGMFQADEEEPENTSVSPFKIKDGVLPPPIMAEVACESQPSAELGEGAIWDERSRKLLFLDIIGSRLLRFDPVDGSLADHALSTFSSAVSSVVPLSDSCDPTGDIVGITLKEGFATYNFKTKQLVKLPNNPTVADRERFNDGKVDTMGRYWAGTIARDSNNDPVHEGALYRRNLDGSVVKVLKGVAISNGLSWDKDGTMYFTDTLTGKIDRLTYDDKTGEVKDRTPCIEGFTFETTGLPDGHCIDSEGMLWVACFNGGMVRRFNPKTGELLAEVHIPAEGGRQVTSCAFGGDDLSDLYITTAHEFMPASELGEKGIPLAGALFRVPSKRLKALGGNVSGTAANRWFLPGAGKQTPTCFCASASCGIQ